MIKLRRTTSSALIGAGLLLAATGANGLVYAQGGTLDTAFSQDEYAGVAMGAHLQGHVATTKFAMILGDLNPTTVAGPNPASPQINFDSVVVINNPYERPISVLLEAFSPTGTNVVDSTTLNINSRGLEKWHPTGFQSLGFGMVRMTSVNASDPACGAVATGASQFVNPNATNLLHRGDLRSWQQLQARQGNTRVHIGPFPFTRGTVRDEINGSYGLGFVMNPNNSPNDVRIDVSIDGSYLPPRFATIDPFGSIIIDDVWQQQIATYNSAGLRTGAIVTVTSVSSAPLPLIAEGFHFDYTEIEDGNVSHGGIPRLASFMGAIEPASLLTGSEVTEWTNGMLVNSTLLIANVSGTGTTLTIAYRDDQANVIATVQQFLGARQSTYVGRALTASVPNVDLWRHTASIRTSNGAKIVGWSMRAVTKQQNTVRPIWGEALLGCNGIEPGLGLYDSQAQYEPYKSVACWTPNVDDTVIDPGYISLLQETPLSAFANNQYKFNFHEANGAANGANQFIDLPQYAVAFTFEDSNFMMNHAAPMNHCIISRFRETILPETMRYVSGIWTSGPEVGALPELPHWDGTPGVIVNDPGNGGGGGSGGGEPKK